MLELQARLQNLYKIEDIYIDESDLKNSNIEFTQFSNGAIVKRIAFIDIKERLALELAVNYESVNKDLHSFKIGKISRSVLLCMIANFLIQTKWIDRMIFMMESLGFRGNVWHERYAIIRDRMFSDINTFIDTMMRNRFSTRSNGGFDWDADSIYRINVLEGDKIKRVKKVYYRHKTITNCPFINEDAEGYILLLISDWRNIIPNGYVGGKDGMLSFKHNPIEQDEANELFNNKKKRDGRRKSN